MRSRASATLSASSTAIVVRRSATDRSRIMDCAFVADRRCSAREAGPGSSRGVVSSTIWRCARICRQRYRQCSRMRLGTRHDTRGALRRSHTRLIYCLEPGSKHASPSRRVWGSGTSRSSRSLGSRNAVIVGSSCSVHLLTLSVSVDSGARSHHCLH